MAVPDCSQYASLKNEAKAWCDGVVPNGSRYTEMMTVISNLQAKGGIFVQLGSMAQTRFPNMRIINDQQWGFGGAAPQGGDCYVIGASWFGYLSTLKSPDGRSRQGTVAHEMDHIMMNGQTGVTDGDGHIINDANNTLNSQLCEI